MDWLGSGNGVSHRQDSMIVGCENCEGRPLSVGTKAEGARADAVGARVCPPLCKRVLFLRQIPPGRGATAAGWRRRVAAIGLAAGLPLLSLHRAHGEDHVDYRFEYYKEESDRIDVWTHSGLFETKLTSWLSLKGEVVYDAISGASPTGSPPPSTISFVPPEEGGPTGPFRNTVPIAPLEDVRYAGSFSAVFSFGPHRLTPQFSYSEENDYISYSGALNYSVDLNQKNTTLNAGWAHSSDTVLPNGFLSQESDKDVDDFLIGVSQLLGPKTVLAVNFTYSHARGYLDDQYKGVLFDNFPQGDPDSPALAPEQRPDRRHRYIIYGAITQHLTPLAASVEGSYRFFHDSYGVDAHTIGLAWHQKIGNHLIVSPVFRYYRQSAASFYVTRLPDFSTRPAHYSADYRLSELESITYGVLVHARVTDWLGFDLGYRRYEMRGLNHITSQSAYPVANIFTIGARIWF
jgi:hypothetical protein